MNLICRTTTRRAGMVAALITAMAVLAAAGCRDSAGTSLPPARAAASLLGPETTPVAIDMALGWCRGHGVPESVCTRCDDALAPRFKAAGDWCDEHSLPESQCTRCHPEVKARWAAIAPGARPAAAPGEPAASVDGGPGAAGFAGEGPSTGTLGTSGMLLASGGLLLSPVNDPLCAVEELTIQFVDASIEQKAGIQVEPARLRLMAASIHCPAEVDFDQGRLARITPSTAGILTEVLVDVGDDVEAGQALAVIESSALGEARSAYIERRENFRLAQADFDRVRAVHEATLRLLQADPTTAPAGADGKDISATAPAAAPVGEAKSRLLKARAAVDMARANYERKARLREQDAASAQAYEAALHELRAAEAELEGTREEITFISQQRMLETERGLIIARSALGAAERRLNILGVSLEPAEREEDAGTAGFLSPVFAPTNGSAGLTRYELRSPLAGRIIERRAVPGEAVDEKDKLFTVADIQQFHLMLDLAQRDLVQIQRGLAVLFTADGLPGQSFRGEVSWISSRLDERTRTVKARADLSNDRELLRAGMFGTARILIHHDEAVSVPEQAVQTDGCCQLVFVKRSDRLFEPRKVTLGTRVGGYAQIVSGLALGEAVVTTGSFLMKTEILKNNIGAGCCDVEPGR